MDAKLYKNLRRVINASGRMTSLGASTQSKKVSEAMEYAQNNYFVMDELYREAGKYVASLCGAKDAFIANSASAGIVCTIASLICQNDISKIVNLSKNKELYKKRNVIIPKGHCIDYGVPIHTMIELAGANLIEAGSANKVAKLDVISLIDLDTLCLFYVKSHHTVQKNMISIEDMIEISKEYNLPLIVDGAAEEDVSKYIKMGVNYVVYSGTKAICAPVSGFVLCDSVESAEMIRLQQYGIGRSMKIGKENIFGLVEALHEYVNKQTLGSLILDDIKDFVFEANQIEGVKASVEQDEAGREIYRGNLVFDKNLFSKSAYEVNEELKKGNPAIFCRDYQANLGILSFDPRPISSLDDLKFIIRRIKEIGGKTDD